MAQDKATYRELRDMLEQHGEAFKIYCRNHCGYTRFAVDSFEDSYCGHFEDDWATCAIGKYVDSMVDDGIICIPDEFVAYFDVDKFARDLRFGGYWEQDGHVFRPV